MNCIDFQSNFVEFIGKSEQSSFNDQAMAHVEVCSACRESYIWYKKISHEFSRLPEAYPSSESLTKIISFSKTYNNKATFNQEWVGNLMQNFWVWLTQSWNWAPAMVCVLLLGAGIQLVSLSLQNPGASVASLKEMSSSGPKGVFISPITAGPDMKKGYYFDSLQDSPLSNGLFRPVALDESAPLNLLYHQDLQSQMEVSADALLMRGRRFKSMGRVDLALKDFDEIYKNYPNYSYLSDVLVYRAQCFAFQGHFDRAIDSLNVMREKYPSKKSFVDSMINQLNKSKSMLLTDSAFQE